MDPRPLRVWGVGLAACGLFALPLSGCTSNGIPGADFTNGIWMLSNVNRVQEGETTSCQPMLMRLELSDDAITIGRRAYPCAADTTTPEPLTLQRNGEALLQGGETVGTLGTNTLDIALSDGRRISWHMDRPDAPWQETETTDQGLTVYSAKLELRPDDTPVPVQLDLSSPEDQPLVGRVHAATLPDDSVTYLLLQPPYAGTMQTFDLKTGEFRLLPKHNFFGPDQFTYFAIRGTWHSPEIPVKIKYVSSPDRPVAQITFIYCTEDKPITFTPDVFDDDGDPLTVTLLSTPKHGQVSVNGAEVTYSPDPDFDGADSFDYLVDDGVLQSEPATIEVFIEPVNDRPIAIGQEIAVTSGSATPITLQATDIDSTDLTYHWDNPTLGDFFGIPPNLVYVPHAGVDQGTETIGYRVHDGVDFSFIVDLKFTIAPGPFPCTLLPSMTNSTVAPEWTVGSNLYYRLHGPTDQVTVWVTDGTQEGTHFAQEPEFDTFGFDNSIGGVRRTVFFNIGPVVYFSTSTKTWAVRLYRSSGTITETAFDIPAPGNDIVAEPSVGDVYVNGGVAYFPIHWRNSASQYVCQVWKMDAPTNQRELVYAFPPANGPCLGLWTLAGEQYAFVGSNLMRFSNMQTPPALVKDLGNAVARPWMMPVGDKLFFQTRTPVGTDTRIDLWVTDGTESGTQIVKQLETGFFVFNVVSPTAFQNQLYFAHEKSLWASDGTPVGTKIVQTIPTSSVVGDGAIGKISVLNDKLFFLATSDSAGREPWVSDGTAVGTKLLRDIRGGVLGSVTASTNSTYFLPWNGQMFFPADDGTGSFLWSTEGTLGGTNLFAKRSMNTIMGILGDNLLFYDGYFLYAMNLL